MATRDLSVTYLRLRSALHRKVAGRDDGGGASGTGLGLLGAAGGAGGIDTAPLALSGASPVYVDMVNDITADMNSIASKMDDLSRAHDQRLRIGFDPSAEAEKEREIDIYTSEITRTFNLSAAKLKRLVRYADNASDATENKVVKNIQRSCATRLHELSTRFRGQQKAYLGHMQRMREGASFGSILGGGSGGGGGAADRDLGFTDEQMHELATAEEDVDERMREIQRIAKSVEDLATLFKELATLVVEQGTILDRIDYNMETAVVHVKKGLEQLQDADKYQKSARPMKCMLVLMCLIIIMTVVVVVRKSGH